MGDERKKDSRLSSLSLVNDSTLKVNYLLVDPIDAKPFDDDRLKPIGSGGSGIVFRAKQVLHDEVSIDRAIKFFIYREDIAGQIETALSGPTSQEEFLEEIRAISGLNHQNLLKVIDAGIAERALHVSGSSGQQSREIDVPFIVTEFIEGPSLESVVSAHERENAISRGEWTDEITRGTEHQLHQADIARAHFAREPLSVLDFLIRICDALEYMHNASVAHCDIAPKNIFLGMTNDRPPLPIVGDLGTSRSLSPSTRDIRLVGSRSYMPRIVRQMRNQIIPHTTFRTMQPHWDLFGFAKTAMEFVESIPFAEEPAWKEPLLHECLQGVLDDRRYPTFGELYDRLRFFLPMHAPRGGVPELTPVLSRARRRLMPISSLAITRRVEKILHHPSVLRLQHVPQITAVNSLTPGGHHSRYEHSLGVMEAMRELLAQLMDRPQFVRYLSPNSIELALLSALLYNVTRFPLSNVVHELRAWGGLSGSKKPLHYLDAGRFLDRHLNQKDEDGKKLKDLVSEGFPNISIKKLRAVLLNSSGLRKEHELIGSFLSSSLDVRVIDFVRRDAMHIGISSGNMIDGKDLFPHLTTHQNKLALLQTGVSIAESIISMRYWLYQRVYWNRPNRALCSVVRRALLLLDNHSPGFGKRFFNIAISKSEQQVLNYLSKQLAAISSNEIGLIVNRLAKTGEHKMIAVYDKSQRDDKSSLVRQIDETNYLILNELNVLLEKELHELGYSGCVIVDYTKEPGNLKLGSDVAVVVGQQTVEPLDRYSHIVGGINRNFLDHLQRFRVYVQYDNWKAFVGSNVKFEDREWVEDKINSLCLESLKVLSE